MSRLKRPKKSPYTVLGEDIYLAYLDGKFAQNALQVAIMKRLESRQLVKDAYQKGYDDARNS